MLNKIFGKKKSGYFLELKEDAKEIISDAKEIISKVSDQPKAEEKPAAPAEATAVKEKQVEEKPAEPVAKSSKSQKKSQKSKKAAASKEKQPEKETNKVSLVTPFPASTSATDKSLNGKVEPTEVAFASEHLLTPTMVRRRPGPSLDAFKNMARQVKKPKG